MPDRLTPEQRHVCMSHIRGKDTSPEMVVRRYLHGEGFRYSLHSRRLPGKPDIVLRKYRTVVMVNGCFWHGHDGCPYFKLPKTRADFWRHKIELNVARDYRERVELELLGWHVITVWECELKPAVREATLLRLGDELRRHMDELQRLKDELRRHRDELLRLAPSARKARMLRRKPKPIQDYEDDEPSLLHVAEDEEGG